MIASERRVRVLEQLATDQVVSVADLAKRFGVSQMTVRRDLRRLEEGGFLRQSYGGATAHLTRSLELAISPRALQHAREKRLIGLAAARLIGGAKSIFIGIGTSCEQLAQFLPPDQDVLVVTGALSVASLLATRPIKVEVLGGPVRRDELSVSGRSAIEALARHRFDIAVIGAGGVSAQWGVTDHDPGEAEVNHVAVQRAARTMVVADGSKIGAAAASVVAPLGSIDLLVTDDSAPADALQDLEMRGLTIHVVSREHGGADRAPRDEPRRVNRRHAC